MKIQRRMNTDEGSKEIDDLGRYSDIQDEYLSEDLRKYYSESRYKVVTRWVFLVLAWLISLILVAILGVVLALRITGDTGSESSVVDISSYSTNTLDSIERVKGTTIGSMDFISVSSLFSQYTFILGKGEGYSDLNTLCLNSSSFADYELSLRRQSAHSYDEYDCTARAFRTLGTRIYLKRVNDIILNNDVYYCYITLTIPDENSLFEYYLRYSYEILQYSNVHGVSLTSFSDYISQIMSYSDFPMVDKEYLFKVMRSSTDNDVFVIYDDSQIKDLCDSIFSTSVDIISDIIGSKLPKENLG